MTRRDIAILLLPSVFFIVAAVTAFMMSTMIRQETHDDGSHQKKFNIFVTNVQTGKWQLTTDKWLEGMRQKETTSEFEFNFVVRQNMHLVSNSLQEIRHFCFDATPYPTGRRGLRRNRNVWRGDSSELSHYKLEFTEAYRQASVDAGEMLQIICWATAAGIAFQIAAVYSVRKRLN